MMKRKKKPGLSAREKRIAKMGVKIGYSVAEPLQSYKPYQLEEVYEKCVQAANQKAARSVAKPKKKGSK